MVRARAEAAVAGMVFLTSRWGTSPRRSLLRFRRRRRTRVRLRTRALGVVAQVRVLVLVGEAGVCRSWLFWVRCFCTHLYQLSSPQKFLVVSKNFDLLRPPRGGGRVEVLTRVKKEIWFGSRDDLYCSHDLCRVDFWILGGLGRTEKSKASLRAHGSHLHLPRTSLALARHSSLIV
jgi:hypothetical protein